MRNLFLYAAFAVLMVYTAGAQEKIPLDAEHWEQLAGEWYMKDGEASISPKNNQGVSLLLKGRTVYDFELSCELFARDAAAVVMMRAHHAPELFSAEKKKVKLGAEGLYGGIFMVGSDQGAMGIFADDTTTTFDSTLGEVKSGEWHTVKVRAEGGKWQLWVDGVARGEGQDEQFIAGGIALSALPLQETADIKVSFRNVQLTDLGRVAKWRPLFNGENLEGWKEWGAEKWSVEEGAIYGRSGEKKSEGYLATVETWKDFRVRGQFQMLGEGNFGLFFHSTITLREEDGFPVIAGVQGEVEPSYPSSTGWVYESYKRGWLVEPPKNTLAAYVLKPKEWNEIEIESKGNHLTTWVNGVRALDFEDPEPQLTEGSFALQLHTGGVDGIAWKELYAAED